MTSFVDLDTDQPGWLLGLVPGRSGAAIEACLAAQPQSWRHGIEVVALDPSAPFAAAIRRALPQATLVVDHWHLVRLANQALTEVRQRAARQLRERRGRKADPAWAHRRLLLAAGDRLGPRGLAGSGTSSPSTTRPTRSVPPGASRSGCASCSPPRPRTTGGSGCSGSTTPVADLAETTRLAETVQAWWPAIEAFLRLGVTNARTEGTNRVIKQLKRVGCGYRNRGNYERRIVLHVAAKSAA